jgi:hypothetical protein
MLTNKLDKQWSIGLRIKEFADQASDQLLAEGFLLSREAAVASTWPVDPFLNHERVQLRLNATTSMGEVLRQELKKKKKVSWLVSFHSRHIHISL